MGGGVSKRYFSYSYDSFNQTFLMFSLTVLTKAAYRNFEKSFFFFVTRLEFKIKANGKISQSYTPPTVMIVFQPIFFVWMCPVTEL